MLLQKKEIIESHIKTHTERSADDVAAVSTVEYFLRTGGRIITNFSRNGPISMALLNLFRIRNLIDGRGIIFLSKLRVQIIIAKAIVQ